ncbi:tigger transposable element-derived protein 6-like [Dermacentor andersoni]|uniref:tigger transposable element-derived protein 6-like n=1 Tax=Dermacentor andersoni TaxID=34620 RepID=UPI002417B605|nr:tigger transposable element-derived protein 6-like [Dermacentor andersoni]
MMGSEKLKQLVIGISKHPHCFKNVATLPVSYQANGKAWMTQSISREWIYSEDARFSRDKRKVLFLVDNCPVHGNVAGLKSIQLEFLPANTTALLQPMDQGVIQALKSRFRKNLLRRMLLCMDKGNDYRVDVLRAIYPLDDGWRQASATTIASCFRHARFASATEHCTQDELDVQDAAEEELLLVNCAAMGIQFDEYVQIDSDVATCPENTVESIVADVCPPDESEDEDEEVEHETADSDPVVTPAQAESAVQMLKSFFRREESSELFLSSLSSMSGAIQRKRLRELKQANIKSFFTSQ